MSSPDPHPIFTELLAERQLDDQDVTRPSNLVENSEEQLDDRAR